MYRAKDPVINRMVALKTLTSAVAEDPNLLERFYREAQSAGSLQHPNIVTIFDLGDEGGTPFIAMELVDGPNLSELIARRSALSLSLKLAYSIQAARAFDYAHKRGIIHRDIKPGNVMVTREDTVKVVDFGIARVLEGSRTQTGTLIGTFAYMAPEVFHGAHASERSDIWSFGVLLYELLAYQAPFSAGSPAALMRTICQQEPARLRQLVRDCPEDLESVVHRALRKSETERYPAMEDLLLELDPIWKRLQAESVTALLEQARHLIGQSEFVAARDALRQALRLDATSTQARTLSEKVNAELTRLAVRPKAQQCVDKGRVLLQEGNLQAARAEADNALRLDSQFGAARELLQQVQQQKERLQLANEYLQSAKQRIVEGLPQEAETLLGKAQEIAPSNPELSVLQQQVRQAKEHHHRRTQLQEALRRVRLLRTQQKYQECLDVLAELQQVFPGENEVARLLETVGEDRAEQTKQERLAEARNLLAAHGFDECIATLEKLREEFADDSEVHRLLMIAVQDRAEQRKRESMAEARKLLSARRHEECIAKLTQLEQEFPKDGEIRRLLDTAREDQAERDRKQKLAAARDLLAAQCFADALAVLEPLLAADANDSAVLKLHSLVLHEQQEHAKSEILQREWEALKELTSRKAYAEAVTRGESLLRRFPGEADLTRLVEFAHSQQAQIENEVRLRAARDQIQEFLQASQFSEAVIAARAALESFPADADLTALLKHAQARQREAMVHEQLERSVREIKLKINRGQLTEAKQLAQEALDKLGPDTDVRQLLWSAELEFDAREKKRRQEQKLESVRAFIRAGKFGEATNALEEISKAGDFDPLDSRLYELGGEIAAAREAAAVPTGPMIPPKADAPTELRMDGEYVVVEGAPSPAAGVPATGPQQAPQLAAASPAPAALPKTASPEVRPRIPQPVKTGHATELTPAAIDRAAHLLARHIGPISGVLAKRAAQRSDSLRTLYQLLAENVESESERARFLRDAGFSDL